MQCHNVVCESLRASLIGDRPTHRQTDTLFIEAKTTKTQKSMYLFVGCDVWFMWKKGSLS